MRYESKPETSKAIAIFTATFGVILIYFAGFVASGLASVVLILLGLALLVLTMVAATANYSVSINRERGLVVKEFTSRIASRKWQNRIGQFNSVRIRTGGRGGFGEGIVVYSAELIGQRTLRITPWFTERAKVEWEAKAISEYLNIPLRTTRK
ncbi:MAG: hypothetical protein V7629_21300 [Motiliproteus sp.]